MVNEKPNEKKSKQQQKEQQQQWPAKTLSYLSVSDTIMDDAEHFKTGSL